MQHDLITSRAAAAILGRSVATITRMVADGRLIPAGKLPGPTGAFLFDRSYVASVAGERKAS